MAARILKWLVGSFIISLMLLLGMIPAGYFIYRDGAELVQEVQKQAKSRASQLTVALGAQASEATTPEAMVALCETMKQLVMDSQTAARGFIVEEAFLIDLEGRVMAHNDVARVARDSGISYSEEKYQEVLMNARRYPLDLEVVGRTNYQPKAPLAMLIPFLERYIPDLRANRFHVAYAVYLPDADVPSGSLHVYLRNQGMDNILDLYWQNVLRTITYSLIAYLALTVILSILLALTIFGSRSSESMAATTSPAGPGADGWPVEEGAFEDRSRDLEEAGFGTGGADSQAFEETEAGSFPMGTPPNTTGSNMAVGSAADTREWPSFPGAVPAGANSPSPNSTSAQRSHILEDRVYESPRVIDRDILDAIPLKNGDRE